MRLYPTASSQRLDSLFSTTIATRRPRSCANPLRAQIWAPCASREATSKWQSSSMDKRVRALTETQKLEAKKEGRGRIEQCRPIVCPGPNAMLLLLVLIHYLRRTSAYATTPDPRRRAAAGKSSADGANGPPLAGRSLLGTVDSTVVVRSTTTSVSVCAIAVGTRISIATRAAVASKTSFFTRASPSTLLPHVRYSPLRCREDVAAAQPNDNDRQKLPGCDLGP